MLNREYLTNKAVLCLNSYCGEGRSSASHGARSAAGSETVRVEGSAEGRDVVQLYMARVHIYM